MAATSSARTGVIASVRLCPRHLCQETPAQDTASECRCGNRGRRRQRTKVQLERHRRAVHCLMEREVNPVAPHPPLPAEAPRVAGLFLGRLLGRLNDIVVRVRRPKSARLRQRSGEWSKRRVRGESIGASPVALPRCRP